MTVEDRKLCVVCSKVYRSDMSTCPDDGTMLVLEAGGGASQVRLGHVIGNYRLIRSLGEGGVGAVYEAEHVRLGRKTALKILHPDVVTDEIVVRFFNEARAVNEIKHPNIIDVEDFVTTPTGDHYMLMELLQGEDLRTAISREGHLAPERVAAIGEQIASALAAVHRVGIVHRDLKPDNLFLVERDGEEICKLLDFGIAKFMGEEQGVTRAGMTMGTPEYMAPEQIMSDGVAGVRGDIYSLGMVMYEALCGTPAFTASNTAAILRAHCYEPVVPPSSRRGEPLPPVLEAAVMKCLEKDQENRFQTADELREALRAETPVTLTTTIAAREQPKQRSRRRAVQMLPAFAMAAAALVLHLAPRTGPAHTAAAATPKLAEPAPIAPAPPPPAPAPAPLPVAPAPATEIQLALTSQPDGAEMFVGAERKPVGRAPVTAAIPMSSTPVQLVARFADGIEVVETIVPDGPRPALTFIEPVPAVAAAKAPAAVAHPVAKPVTSGAAPVPAWKGADSQRPPANDDREGTLDPFK
ncbi:MAG: serine/threonine protein kinase [Myxococcales bacterium]|nr:serine/threonine protein kinase [Myxococcales bacterium]